MINLGTTKPKKRICIGIPCFHSASFEVLDDYMRFAFHIGRRMTDYDFFIAIKGKSEQFRARNAIVEAALQNGCDYLLMLDDDHIIDTSNILDTPIDVTHMYGRPNYGFLQKLVDHMEADPKKGIVGALYYQRGGDRLPVIMQEIDGKPYFLQSTEVTGRLQQVDVTGGGCMLLNMKIFDKIEQPWFCPEHEYGTDIQVCKSARKAGFTVWCDTSIVIGHLRLEKEIITGKKATINRDTKSADESFDRVREVMQGFRADVREYLGVSNDSELVNIARKYHDHAKNFDDYRRDGRLKDYYIESGFSYLARACFIRGTEENRANAQFDDFVLRVAKDDYPGIGIDFGCGSAPITFELLKAQQQIYFYDVTGSAPYEFLKWRTKKHGLNGTKAIFPGIGEWPAPGSVDYALCLDSIEHLPDGEWQPVIKNISECLRYDGFLMTNFLVLNDNKNPEHINMDRGAFLDFTRSIGLATVNAMIFQKKEAPDA